MKVAVTGGSGNVGSYVISELMHHNIDAVSIDRTAPSSSVRFVRADLTDLGQTVGVLAGADAVIHLAAIPHPMNDPPEVVFRNNVTSTYNVLAAANMLDIRRVVLTSSDSAIGIVFAHHHIAPEYVPVDEDHPLRPQDPYGLSKQVGEVLADSFAHQNPELTVVTLRPPLVIFPEMYQPEAWPHFPLEWKEPERGKSSLWCYVDVRDLAVAFRLALTAPLIGHQRFFVAAPNSRMKDTPSAELVRRYFPETEQIDLSGTQSLLNSARAQEALGWRAEHTWEKYVAVDNDD